MKFLYILILVISFSVSVYSQTGTISGTIKDSSGTSLPDVNVKIKGSYIGTATDESGNYQLKGINTGEYTVQVSAIGYKTLEYTGIKVKNGEDTKLDIKLNVTSYTVGEEIVVI